MWRKELNFFLNVTQRIEPFFSKCDSKNWTFFEYNSKNWIFARYIRLKVKESNLLFFNTTQRIEHFFLHVTHVFIWFKELIFFLKNFSKNWFFIWLKEWYLTQRLEIMFFFSIWLKELNLFRFDSKIWFYSVWPQELNFVWLGLTELDPFLEYDSENSKFFLGFLHVYFFSKMTQRIEPFFLWIWRKELNPFFFDDSQTWSVFFFKNYDAKNFFFEKCDSKNWTLFCMTQRIEPFFSDLPQRIEFFFLNFDSKNWAIFSK